MKEIAKKTSWTISFNNKTDKAAEKNNPQWFDVTYTINVTATKQSGEEVYGTYNAKGSMKGVIDGTRYQMLGLQMTGGGAMMDVLDMTGEGPLENFTFELQKPLNPVSDDYFQMTYGSDLAPLVRESCIGAVQDVPVVWPGQYQMYTHVQEYIYGAQDSGNWDGSYVEHISFWIYTMESGRALLVVSGLPIVRMARFWGSVTKKVDWKQVK